MEGEMAKQSADQERLIDRRTVLRAGVGLVIAGPTLVSGENAEAQTRPKVIIDSQVHAYAANTPERPWFRVPNWPAHVTGDEMVAAINAIRVFAVSALLLTPLATSWAQQRPAVAEKMAKTFGIDSFGQVDGLRYTFNVERPGVSVARS